MNLRVFCLGVIAYVAAVTAEMIDYGSVQPFAQPVPVTNSEKSAVMYKPQLRVLYGCYPHAAVQADGAVGGGMLKSIPNIYRCKKPLLGSQVYSRSDWFEGKWAIVYAWYFPAGNQYTHMFLGHRHSWLYGIVWLDSPNPDNSTILGVSMSGPFGIKKAVPPESKYVFGHNTVKFAAYKNVWTIRTGIRLTTQIGNTQNLITWEQLTDEARTALSETDFDNNWFFNKVKMPLRNGTFTEVLEKAYPF